MASAAAGEERLELVPSESAQMFPEDPERVLSVEVDRIAWLAADEDPRVLFGEAAAPAAADAAVPGTAPETASGTADVTADGTEHATGAPASSAPAGVAIVPGRTVRARFAIPGGRSTLRLRGEGGPVAVELREGGSGGVLLAARLVGDAELAVENPFARYGVLSLQAEGGPAARVSLARSEHVGSHGNLVVIVVDTLRADHVNPPGRELTPALGRLAAEGISFPLAFSHAPITLPSHAALFSSRMPHRSGILSNLHEVGPELPLLADWLRDFGYQTAAAVSLWTMVAADHGTSIERGFDRYDRNPMGLRRGPETLEKLRQAVEGLDPAKPFFLFAHFADPHEPYSAHGRSKSSIELWIDGRRAAEIPTSDWRWYHETLELEPGIRRLELRSQDPFKIHYKRIVLEGVGELPLQPVSVSEGPPRSEMARIYVPGAAPRKVTISLGILDVPDTEEIRQRYALEVGFVDRCIGELARILAARGMWEDTLVLFTSDHGESLGEHDLVGHVQNLHDVLVRVPLILKLPRERRGEAEIRRASAGVVRHLDLVPTVLELLGLPPLPGQEGISLMRQAERIAASETHRPEALRDLVGMRDLRHRLVYAPAEDRFELYDLLRDPGETTDFFGHFADLTPEVRAKLGPWMDELRAMAAESEGHPIGAIDPERERQMKALGYGGETPENAPSPGARPPRADGGH